MKRLSYVFAICLLVTCVFTSCDFTLPTYFDDTYLFSNGGKWEAPSDAKPETDKLYYIYYEDGTGKFWDEGEDRYENDLLPNGNGWFTWEVDGADMLHIYKMDNQGADVPQSYTLTKLTSTTLEYTADNNKKYSFTKVISLN